MSERIAKHKATRDVLLWTTVEEGIDLIDAVCRNRPFSTYLVDCLTLWVSNMMEQKYKEGSACNESDIETYLGSLFQLLEKNHGNVIFVTNEVGMGIVPENMVARAYRDLVGRCNRLVAARASEVILVSCGLPLYLKKA
jgi:adenosylcobinamide kinase/adenosylcobinamide-phosphate guanylyltransferase